MSIKWIGTQKLGEEIEPLLAQYETIFIECELYTVLMRAIRTLKELNPDYQTDLFSAEWCDWNYHDPNNLNLIKNEMRRNPNERVYLQIDTKSKTYTACNSWRVHRIFDQNSSLIVTTPPYARKDNYARQKENQRTRTKVRNNK